MQRARRAVIEADRALQPSSTGLAGERPGAAFRPALIAEILVTSDPLTRSPQWSTLLPVVLLRDLGVDSAQGFHIGQPARHAAFAR